DVAHQFADMPAPDDHGSRPWSRRPAVVEPVPGEIEPLVGHASPLAHVPATPAFRTGIAHHATDRRSTARSGALSGLLRGLCDLGRPFRVAETGIPQACSTMHGSAPA